MKYAAYKTLCQYKMLKITVSHYLLQTYYIYYKKYVILKNLVRCYINIHTQIVNEDAKFLINSINSQKVIMLIKEVELI